MADVTLTQQFYADTLDQLVSAMRTQSTGRVHANHTCMLHGCYWVLLAPCLAPRLGHPAQSMARTCQRTGEALGMHATMRHAACLQHAARSRLPAWALLQRSRSSCQPAAHAAHHNEGMRALISDLQPCCLWRCAGG